MEKSGIASRITGFGTPLVTLWAVAATAALCTVILGHHDKTTGPFLTSRISSTTPLYIVARHFGHPTLSLFNGTGLTNSYVSRNHDWSVVLYIHPRPRRH